MIDPTRTLELIKGALFDPDRTWANYKSEASDWQKTAFLLTGPLIIGCQLLSYLMSLVFSSAWFPTPGLGSVLITIVAQAAAAVAIAFVVALLAGLFRGKNSFPLALAATSLAFVPGYLGAALLYLPWLGFLLSVALGIYGLVLLWRILPLYLDIPADTRVGHYILSLVGCVVTMVILGSMLGAGYGNAVMRGGGWESGDTGRPSGMFGEMERHALIMESADEDTYDPPRNGKLSKGQVRDFVSAMAKTREYREEQGNQLQALSDKAEANEAGSLGDALSGMGSIMSLSTAEMEVVKTGGGNWAEHQWIKEQLRVARIQKDINDAVKHNYELYQDFEDELRELSY